jgi:hypothetical protein
MPRRWRWEHVVSALCADSFEPQARRYNRIPNSALATDSFPESILGWTNELADWWIPNNLPPCLN